MAVHGFDSNYSINVKAQGCNGALQRLPTNHLLTATYVPTASEKYTMTDDFISNEKTDPNCKQR